MKNIRLGKELVVVLLAVFFGGLAAALGGCENTADIIGPAMAETRAVADDAAQSAEAAKINADQALAQSLLSGDPEDVEVARRAVDLAKIAEEKAESAANRIGELETRLLDYAEKIDTGEFGSAEGAELGGLLGSIGGPQFGVLGTVVGGVVGGWWYRRIARGIVAGVDAARKASPEARAAMGTVAAKTAAYEAHSPASWKFTEAHRNT